MFDAFRLQEMQRADMNNDELRKSLELEAAPITIKGGGAALTTIPALKPAEATPVLKLDRWDIHQGQQLLKNIPELAALKLPDAAAAVSDLLACAFKPYPEQVEDPTDKARAAFITALLDSGEAKALRVSTVLNPLASDIAAVQFAQSYSKFLEELANEEKEECDGDSEESAEGEDEETEGGNSPSEVSEPDDGETDSEDESSSKGESHEADAEGSGSPELSPAEKALKAAAKSAINTAVREATKKVDQAEKDLAVFGYGQGSSVAPPSQKHVANLFQRIRNNPSLRRIMDIAGRFREMAKAKQKAKSRHAIDEVSGVAMGDKVERLLTHELSRLTDPELEDDVLRRIVDREAMLREVKGKEKLGKGPIIVCVDESSSMCDKIEFAKAFALAMAWIARHQKRWCGLVAYTGGISYVSGTSRQLPQCPYEKTTPGIRTLVFPPNKKDDNVLLDWLDEFMGWGSSIDIPLREMPDVYEELNAPVGVCDCIFVTDAECSPPQPVIDKFNDWKKKAKARLITLVIGDKKTIREKTIRKFSDEVYYAVDMLGSEGVDRCLSI